MFVVVVVSYVFCGGCWLVLVDVDCRLWLVVVGCYWLCVIFQMLFVDCFFLETICFCFVLVVCVFLYAFLFPC